MFPVGRRSHTVKQSVRHSQTLVVTGKYGCSCSQLKLLKKSLANTLKMNVVHRCTLTAVLFYKHVCIQHIGGHAAAFAIITQSLVHFRVLGSIGLVFNAVFRFHSLGAGIWRRWINTRKVQEGCRKPP